MVVGEELLGVVASNRQWAAKLRELWFPTFGDMQSSYMLLYRASSNSHD